MVMKYFQRLCLFLALFAIFRPLNAISENDGSAQTKKKYALVIGGASQLAEPEHHEFARLTAAITKGLNDHGYEVTTLFGGSRAGTSNAKEEQDRYSEDYKFIDGLKHSQKNPTANADSDGIAEYFKDLLSRVKSGDQVEIHIAAHGSDSCGSTGQFIQNDLGSSCKHTFTIFDSDGKPTEFSSEDLLKYVKKLEDKGALPTVIFNSCHSGRAKQAFKDLGLKNTCAYFQTAGNELGYGCFENDPDFAKDYTSTGEYVALRYYGDSLSRLQKDPYFSKSVCFQKVAKHFEDHKVDLSSVSSSYWTSRVEDATFQSPSMSTQLGFPYFTTGLFQPQIVKSQSLSCDQLGVTNMELIKQLSNLGGQISAAITSPYTQALGEYNASVEALRLEIEKKSPETPERLEQIAALQKTIKDRAADFMLQERKLIDQLFKNQKVNPDPCRRSL